MSGKFSYVTDQSFDQTLNYSDSGSSGALADSIAESYVTCIGDNETQYLSVLETTNDITLEDLQNLTLSNSKNDDQTFFAEADLENCEKTADVDQGDQQVVVFTIDGSSDLYGIQVMQDEHGNFQKYQFKFRSTENGQIEAIPESFQLLPDEDDIQGGNELLLSGINSEGLIENENNVNENEENINFNLETQESEGQGTLVPEEVFIKAERDTPDILDTNSNLPQEEEFLEMEQEEHISAEDYQNSEADTLQNDEEMQDTKSGIVLQHNISTIKQEEFPEYPAQYAVNSFENMQQHNLQNEEIASGGIPEENEEYQENQEEGEPDCLTYQIVPESDDIDGYQHVTDSSDDGTQTVRMTINELSLGDRFEEVFVEGGDIQNLVDNDEIGQRDGEAEIENESDNDDYQIIEGLHVTGEVDSQDDFENRNTHSILQEVLEKPIKSSILKNSMILSQSAKKVEDKLVYCVYKYPEKENVNSLTNENINIFKPSKVNPRSILKSSFLTREKSVEEDDKLNKRFARNKEAVQAKQFQNFISKTTIQYAPERRSRLPRKQEIKPVDDRRDAEIIVQEVLVSSNGFVEDIDTMRQKKKDKLHVTAIVELSDSDDDDRQNKENEVIDSDSDVIEIGSDDDENSNETEMSKRGRGRPKKLNSSPTGETSENHSESLKKRRGRPAKNLESPSKKSKTDSDSERELEKKEIPCEICQKTFPSLNSLKTHIQHHNLENKLKSSQNKKSEVKIEFKHKCDKCETNFKNSILLSRHICSKKVEFSCSICLKKFTTQPLLDVHKKVHIKQNLIKNTTLAKVSPKRSTTLIKKPTLNILRCKDCPKICSSLSDLTNHAKSHQKFACQNCPATFSSKILLDTHIRVNCVKQKSPANKRLSFKVRKSCVALPRQSTVKKSAAADVSLNRSILSGCECETCGKKFSTYRNLYMHKVQEHGMDTPDKSLLEKPKKMTYKPRATHGGIPANDKLKKAYAELRMKLELVPQPE